MGRTYTERHNKKHFIQNEISIEQFTPEQNNFSLLRPLLDHDVYESQICDPKYGRDPCWEKHLYDQGSLSFKHDDDKLQNKIEDDNETCESHTSDEVR